MARPHPHKRAARLAAVSILSVLAAVVAVWAAPRVSDAVAAWMSTPPVRAAHHDPAGVAAGGFGAVAGARRRAGLGRRGRLGDRGAGRRSVDGRADHRRRHALHDGRRDLHAAHAAGRRRTCSCAPAMTETRGAAGTRSSLERAAEEGGREQAFTEPIWTGGRPLPAGRRARRRRRPSRRRRACAACASSPSTARRTPTAPRWSSASCRRAAATVAGLELAPPVGAMTTRPTIVTRAQWGANESWRSGSPDYAPVKMAFVHHTASGNDYSRRGGARHRPRRLRLPHQVAALERRRLQLPDRPLRHDLRRALRRGHARASSALRCSASTPAAPASPSSARSPTRRLPPRPSTSLERLLAWKLDVHHVDPQGTGDARLRLRPEVRDRAAGDVPGHRRPPRRQLHRLSRGAGSTRSCPTCARWSRAGGSPRSTASSSRTQAISPDGDGVRDKATIGFTVSQTATWRVEIRDDAGRWCGTSPARARSSRSPGRAGTTTARSCPDGVYDLQADATSAAGEARPADGDAAPRHGGAARERRRDLARPVQPQRRRAERRRDARVHSRRGRHRARVGDRDGRDRAASPDRLEGREPRRPSA